MWFFEVAILEITIRFFKFVWEILPIQPTIQTRENNEHPPFFLKMRTFFNNRPRWFPGEFNPLWNHRGRFLKKVLIFEKKGGCWCFFKTTFHLEAKAQDLRVRRPSRNCYINLRHPFSRVTPEPGLLRPATWAMLLAHILSILSPEEHDLCLLRKARFLGRY
jgi:hypothetical protein